MTAVGTPVLISAASNNRTLFPEVTTNYGLDCVIDQVKVTLYLTTTIGFINTPSGDYRSPGASISVCGNGVGFSGCTSSSLFFFVSNATGNQLGSACGNFVFDTTATAPFDATAPPPAPYDGTYQLDPTGSGVGDNWRLKNIQFDLSGGGPPDLTLQCAKIDLTTKIVPIP